MSTNLNPNTIYSDHMSNKELQGAVEKLPISQGNTAETRWRRCAKCGCKKLGSEFGRSAESSDGLQSYCKDCKNGLNKKRLTINVGARLRHHFATRIATSLGKSSPQNLVRDLETYLGYTINQMTSALSKELQEREGKNLRTALNEGYHVDHIMPLSSFKYINTEGIVDWDAFTACWAISNLRAIPGADNLAKGKKILE